MAGPWDTPPTEEELGQAKPKKGAKKKRQAPVSAEAWNAPPTPGEMNAPLA